ncbi:DnaJ domain-containing protein [Myxococcaceae bacterium GXIMD 01537]
MSEIPDPYAVLGVERTAEPRDIKRAYFTKIREFPPETHPEEFQRLRAAYELLSDAEARRRYDESQRTGPASDVDPEITARMERAMALHNEGHGAEARAVLEELIAKEPDFYAAWDMLGMFLLREGYAEAALARFERLVKEQPDFAGYHLHRGYALQHLERYGEAVEAHQRARDLDPDEPQVWVALTDCLTDAGRLDDALEQMTVVIDRVQKAAAPGDLRVLDLRLHRVELHLRAKAHWTRISKEVDWLLATLPEQADEALKRSVATRLGALSAGLFANDRPEEANLLLMRCRQLNPDSAVEVAYPPKVTLDVDALPPDSRKWVADEVAHTSWTQRLLASVTYQVMVVGGVGIVATLVFCSRTERGGVLFILGLLLILAALGLTASTRALLERLVPTQGRAVSLHALYVVDVQWSRVTLWPLFHLRDVQLTNNGSSRGSSNATVRVLFRDGSVSATFDGDEQARSWAQSVVSQRRRVMELLSRGMLEAEQGLDFVPASLLLSASKEEGARKGQRRPFAVAAGVALALFLAALPLNFARVDEEKWGEAYSGGTFLSARGYLTRNPEGRHAEQARAVMAERYAEARARLAGSVPAGSTGAKALGDVLAALEAKGLNALRFVQVRTVDSLLGNEAQRLSAAGPSQERAAKLKFAVQDVLTRSLSREVPLLDDEERPLSLAEPASPVTLVLRETVRPSGSVYKDSRGGQVLHAVEVRWEVELRFEGEKQPRYHFASTHRPSPSLRVGAANLEPEQVYDEMLRLAASDFFARWVENWGLPGARDPVRPPSTFAVSSVYSPYP